VAYCRNRQEHSHVIPARLASTRLPNKPLADIWGQPMIIHVLDRAREADIGPVVVASADHAIAEAVRQAGGEAVMTDPAHPSGSDRVHEAVERLDPDGRHDLVVNVQGDLPTVEPVVIRASLLAAQDPAVDIGTAAAAILRPQELDDPNVNKAVVSPGRRWGETPAIGRALYFSKLPVPYGEGPHYHHIGLYCYRRAALRRFVALPQGVLERRERLEQLRALENGMRIDVAIVDTVPLGVDTDDDLARARQMLGARRLS
jgi:3-deoxy-manno-octulosonate cytidylyltransferase (CMP-KDO synthetase)